MTSCRPPWMKQKVSQPWCPFKPRPSFWCPLLTCRAFKQCGPRPLRGIANSEFTEAVNALEQADLGKVRSAQVRFAPHPVQGGSSSKNLRMSTALQIYAAKTIIDPSTIKMPTNVSLPLSSGHWSMRTSFHKKCSQMFRYVTLAN